MPWGGASSARAARGKGNGKGGGGSGNGPQTAAGSGGAAAGSRNLTEALNRKDQRITKLEADLKAATQPAARTAAAARKYWTCGHCGDAKCFTTRKECHACGKPRAVPTPPGLANAPAEAEAVDQVMAEELPLEEQISRTEAEVKSLKAISVKTQRITDALADSETDLKKLRERQRQERPLPARLQAATDRVVKVTANEAETSKELEVHEGHVTRLKAKLAEIAEQKLAAEKELEAVKAMAGAGASETAISNFANCMQEELTKQGMQEQQFVMLLSAVWSRMQAGTAAQQPGSLGPAAAAAPAASQPQPPTAVEAAATMDQVRLINMGAALATAAAQEQAAQIRAAEAKAAAEALATTAAEAAQAAAEATQHREATLAAAQAEEMLQQQRQQHAQAGSGAAAGGRSGRPRGRSPASEEDSGDSVRLTPARSRSETKKVRKQAKQLRAAEQRAARAAGLGCC